MRTFKTLMIMVLAFGACKRASETGTLSSQSSLAGLQLRDNYSEQEIRKAFKAWPAILVEAPRLGTMPRIPSLPPLPVAVPRLGQHMVFGAESDAYRALRDRLRQVLNTSPLDELRNSLLPRLDSGEIIPYFGEMDDAAARLILVDGKEAYAAIGKAGTNPRTKQMVMILDANGLARLGDEREIARFSLLVFHEYKHVEQHDKGAEIYDGNRWLNPVECAEVWTNERSAYLKECETDNRWGGSISGFAWMCEAAEAPDAFSQRTFVTMVQDEFKHRGPLLHCAYVWALYARHPHPEMFR